MSILNGNRYRVLTVNFENQDQQPIPFIHLQGKWLEKLGFEAGDKIEVELQQGVLIIRQLVEENSMRKSFSSEPSQKQLFLSTEELQ